MGVTSSSGTTYYKWEFHPDASVDQETAVWFGTTEEPTFVPEHEGYWEMYDYEDYVGLMHAVLAMELGLDTLGEE